MTLQKLWSGCKKSLVVVTVETFVRCHRTGPGWYWSWLSRAPHRQGRKAVSQEVHDLAEFGACRHIVGPFTNCLAELLHRVIDSALRFQSSRQVVARQLIVRYGVDSVLIERNIVSPVLALELRQSATRCHYDCGQRNLDLGP